MTTTATTAPQQLIASTSSTIPTTTPAITPVLAAHLRLSTLTHLVHGSTSPLPASSSSTPPALIRLTQILKSLSTLTSDKSISHLLSNWDHYSSLLQPHQPSPPSITPDSQIALLLTQQTDLQEALSTLQTITLLLQQGVLEAHQSKTLARITQSNQPTLTSLQKHHSQLADQTRRRNARLLQLVSSWSEYIDALSGVFVMLDREVARLESEIGRLERLA